MKQYMKLLSVLALGLAMGSCVDDAILPYSVEKPENVAQYEYLKDYNVLKSYIDRSQHPNFMLGLAAAVSDFVKHGVVYETVTTNFDEMTAGNAMKYASIVGDDGTMNFSTVSSFVDEAKAAGITIYGHTLAWHAQQNLTYLNGLIADKEIEVNPSDKEEKQDAYVDYSTFTSYPFYVMGYEPVFENGCLVSRYPGEWYQYFVADQIPTTIGQTYKLTAYIKGSAPGTLNAQFGNWGALVDRPLSFNEDWQEVSVEFDNCQVESSFIVFQPGTFEGDINIKWLKVTHSETPTVEIYTDVLENGEMVVGKPMNNFIVREHGKADVPGTILEGQGPDGKNCISITSISAAENTHDTQFFITSDKVWEAGEQYRISFWYKATAEAPCETQCHTTPGSYFHWAMLPANPTFTTEWKHYETISTIPAEAAGKGMQTIAFNLNADKENGHTYYFADIHWETVEKGNTIPLTPEEKKDTLTWAMNNWVEGMMKATGGYVTAWDVVNEAISGGGDNGEGFYPLQSASNVSADDANNNFYWQDYLGNEDYVRIVVAAARKYYADNGGTEPLKLFINDYNLESWWDGNKKAQSLVHWIEKWEADGVTKIDGIGTQMHVSYILNESDQKAQEDAIVKMFQILAESGKLIKISELDMGVVEKAFGTGLKTEDITYEQHLKMAEFYRFIISKYFEIIPAAQQYGITQWCATDAPSDSGWRGGEPVGLWDSNYNRKHTYAGFADGLAGK